MKLPPSFFDELHSRVSIAGVIGRKVSWDTRKTKQAKGDYWASCPFHSEKTASFHVDDTKGYYYCFGCQAKGSALTFLREAEGMEFMEAVRFLAEEAGLKIPESTPEQREVEDRRERLFDAMEEAVSFFRGQLGRNPKIQEYLAGRGLSQPAIERFEVGYAPDSWDALFTHLSARNFGPETLLEAGLCGKSEKTGALYDRFRDRIQFPIRDGRGRCMAFGGRAQDPDATAKYLNSPETPIFSKSHSLYNLRAAREAVRKNETLVVAEGYMDVIALSEAGFGAAVAPLGTAITAEQLRMIWRMSPEPVIALDGDEAGQRAASRLVDMAMPSLGPTQSLRVCLLPEGMDPDDLIRSSGAERMRDLVNGALPISSLLWRRETEGKVFDSPERQAALERKLLEAAERISDSTTKKHYLATLRNWLWQHFRGSRSTRSSSFGKGRDRALSPSQKAKSSPLASEGADSQEEILEGAMLAICFWNPKAAERHVDKIEAIPMGKDEHRKLLELLIHDVLSMGIETHQDAMETIRKRAAYGMIERLYARPHVRALGIHKPESNEIFAENTLLEAFEKLQAERGLREESREQSQDLMRGSAEGSAGEKHNRFREAVDNRDKAMRGLGQDERIEFKTGENGVPVSVEESRKLKERIQRTIQEKYAGS